MTDPHPDFTAAMYDGYRRARTEAHYNAPYFFQMLQESNGYDTACQLIQSAEPTTGFTHLWERKRLDLTVEALVIRPQWSHLFSHDDLWAAYHRLEDYNYDFPPDSWTPNTAKETPQAFDRENVPPNRVATTTYRVLRDTLLARRVKAMHDFKCQICGLTIVLPDGSRYAEAHHIQPLGTPHDGPDVIGNILCVCPNHHAELDYGVRSLDLSRMDCVADHTVESKYVDYHNRNLYKSNSA